MSEACQRETKMLEANEKLKAELAELRNQMFELEANSENLKRPALSDGYLAKKSARLYLSSVGL